VWAAFVDFGRNEDSFARIRRSEDLFAGIARCEESFATIASSWVLVAADPSADLRGDEFRQVLPARRPLLAMLLGCGTLRWWRGMEPSSLAKPLLCGSERERLATLLVILAAPYGLEGIASV
jgi:hypothetical protein